jgi:light-regulated signal transduction histidine kinase (bacteriophytochrome)
MKASESNAEDASGLVASLQEELARSKSELEQFVSVVSHDLQEPLRMVNGYTQLLARRYQGKLDAEADEFIRFTMDGVSRMQEQIQALLAYSRVTTRGETIVPVDSEAVLERVTSILECLIQESGARVTHAPLPSVPADASQLAQVFRNLIENGIKFRGPEPPRIHIAAVREGAEWIFSVKDNGMAIDPAQVRRVFGMFQRLQGREYPGLGAGLATCKRILERHGGRIWVESELGKGSTFRFALPVEL